MLGRVTAYAVWSALLLATLGGCDGDGGAGDRPSLSPTISPTRTLPEPTRTADSPEPEPTESQPEPEPTETQPEPEPEPEPTEIETETEPTPEPEPEPSEPEPSETEPSEPDPSEPEPSETETPADEQEDDAAADTTDETEDDKGTPAWLWWLLAALAVLAVLVIGLFVRSRRRGSWEEQYDAAVAEVAWFARELLPQLRRAGTLERMAGGWQVGSARVGAAEDRLTGLEATAPDETAGAAAHHLREAVRLARGHMQALVAPGPHPEWALDVDDVIAALEAALGSPRPPRDG